MSGCCNEFVPGGGSGGGSSSSSDAAVLTYRPGSGLSGPAVFDTWGDLYTKLQSLRTVANDSGIYTIVFDDQDAAVTIPVGAYDMDRAVWIGVRWWRDGFVATAGYQVPVAFDQGVTVTHLAQIEGLALTNNSTDPVITVGALETLTLIGTQLAAGGADAVIILDDGGMLRLGDQARAQDSTITATVDGAPTILLDGAQATLESNALIAGAIYTVTHFNASSRVLWPQGATITHTTRCAATLYDNGNPATKLTAPLGAIAIDTTTGALYSNTDGATAWVGTTIGGNLIVNGNLTANNGLSILYQTWIQGYFARQQAISPAALGAGTTNDYDLNPGMNGASRIRQATNAANSAIGGMVPNGVNGSEWEIKNLGPGTLTFLHEEATEATPAYRYALEGGVNRVVGVDGVVIITYDTASSRWNIIG